MTIYKMNNFSLQSYRDCLWIKEIHRLKNYGKNKYVRKSGECLQYVTVFGTIVEVKCMGQFNLYSVDDGTGVILCRHEVTIVDEPDISWDGYNLSNTLGGDGSIYNDSVFNDQSVQHEDRLFHRKSCIQALRSLQSAIFSTMYCTIPYKVGDMVCIHGRVYTYFKMKQVYVNAIRPITLNEELHLSILKLEQQPKPKENHCAPFINSGKNFGKCTKRFDRKEESVSVLNENCDRLLMTTTMSKDGGNVSKRISGLMTFDSFAGSRLQAAPDILPLPDVSPGSVAKITRSPIPLPNVSIERASVSTFDTMLETTMSTSTHLWDEAKGMNDHDVTSLLVKQKEDEYRSSTDDDLFIEPTPVKKKTKMVKWK